MSNWRGLITKRMQGEIYGPDPTGDTWNDVIHCTMTADDLDRAFDSGYGSPEGKPFTLWTNKWVYFPVCYDASESVGAVPRDPRDIATKHLGGW